MFCCHLCCGNKKVKNQKARIDEEKQRTRVATIGVASSPSLHLLSKPKKKTGENAKRKSKEKIKKTTQYFATEQSEGKCKKLVVSAKWV